MIFKGEEKIQLISNFNQIAKSIREHNRIHQKKEPNCFFISEYLEMAADLFDKIAEGDIQEVRHGQWLSHFEYCKLHNYSPSGTSIHFWCSRCESAAEEKTLYCPNCGARMDLKGEG